MTAYGVYLYEQVAELDFVGPQQVFAASNVLLGSADRVYTMAASKEILRGVAGLRILPDFTLVDAPEVDVLLVPGAADLCSALDDAAALAWIAGRAPRVRWLTAVCTGALILRKAGLLRGRRATTHWQLVPELASDPEVTVLPEMRYVRDGNIVTSQGVSAGIDMALWVVGQLHGPDHARAVRKLLQYDPAPPYVAEV